MATKTKDRPRISGKQMAGAAAVVAGVAAIGAGIFFAKDKSTPRPDYDTLTEDGEFSIREYPALLVAETIVQTPDRFQAQSEGFQRLADYIFAKSRPGEKIAMTAPVLIDRAHEDGELDGESGWRVRFVMPEGHSRENLPPTPATVEIAEIPARRVGVAEFSGRWSDQNLQEEEGALRRWLENHDEHHAGTVEYAFYDAPSIPPLLRRNEVLVPLG